MATEHSTITDPDIHEPKGVAAATAGQAYIADGAASGTWTDVYQFASVYSSEADAVSVSSIGTTPQTLPFANDAPDNICVSDSANNRITLTNAGIYFVLFDCSFSTAAAGDAGLYEFKLLDDGVATGYAVARQMSGTSDTGSCSFSAIITAGAGSQLTITVESDDAGSDDINIYTTKLIAFKVG